MTVTDLPTSIVWEPGNLHPVGGTARPGCHAVVVSKVFSASCSPGELYSEPFTHECGSIWRSAAYVSHLSVGKSERI